MLRYSIQLKGSSWDETVIGSRRVTIEPNRKNHLEYLMSTKGLMNQYNIQINTKVGKIFISPTLVEIKKLVQQHWKATMIRIIPRSWSPKNLEALVLTSDIGDCWFIDIFILIMQEWWKFPDNCNWLLNYWILLNQSQLWSILYLS